MHPFILCHNGSELQIKRTDELGAVSRVCATKDDIFLLSNGIIFYGTIPTKTNEELCLKVMFRNIIDMDMWQELFYIVDSSGVVHSRNVDYSWTEIVFDPLEIAEERIRISRVKCNSLGAIFITNNREIYAMGTCGELFNCQLPIRLKSFDKPILDISAGEDFFILVVENEYNDLEGQHFGRNFQRNASSRPGNSSRINSENSLSSRESDAAMCLEDNIQDILRCGYALLHTTVCSFGNSNNGVLGTGDHIKRSGINHVLNLCEIGVCSISTGREHSIARTIDGRIFHWGLNSHQQLQNGNSELSSPTELRLDTVLTDSIESHVLEACCGDYRSVFLKLNGERIEKDNGDFLQRQLLAMHVSNVPQNIPLILTAKDFNLYNNFTFQQAYYPSLLSLQQCLHFCQRGETVIRSLQSQQKTQPQFVQICQNYLQVLYTLFACCKSLESFYRGDILSFKEILWFRNTKEVIKIFEDYTKACCDLKSVNGFGYTNQATSISDNTTAPKEMLEQILTHPFGQISNFVKLLETLAQHQKEEPSSNELNEKLLLWQEFARQSRIDIELAEHTHDFWMRNEKNLKIRPFMKKHRRVILAPSTFPIKWYSGMTMGTNCFILFSDCLCQYGGSSLQTYPLVVLWVKKESESRLKLTTPEKTFSLEAKSHEDKTLWFELLETSIMAALGRPNAKMITNVRTTAYVFSSKHPKYPKVHAYGRWRNGIMHGKCYLEYPDGKFYFGDVRNGEIEGHGKMVIPSVGMYEGNFKAGKFHGYGCFEMKDNEVYDGNFRDGQFHGHGVLRTNTYTYVGEYQANAKCGYGILDDMVSGDKYMGMFADNKRVGAGTCITMTGDYFEGIFVNDELTGQGIAVFENDYYYDGELTVRGPAGKGTYYMPHGTIEGEIDDTDDTKCHMIGNVISGHLSGSWNDVRVITGSVAINRRFPKFPKSIGELVVDNSRKWRTLFDNFEEHIIGSRESSISPKYLWNRIAVFMTNQKNREKCKEYENIPSSTHSYFAKNISMGYSSSFDKISLKSTNSLMLPSTKVSYMDLKNSLSGSETQPKKSYSQETLYDGSDGQQCEISFNEENILSSSMLNAQFECWASDSLTSTSTRSSIDSTANLNSSISNGLEFVPSFGVNSLTDDDITSIKEYLGHAFKDPHHPLHLLNQKIANCFYTSYGCWKVKPTPILAKQAMLEWESISKRVYNFVRKLFPALPEDFCSTDGSREVISHISLLYPIVLSEGIYSTLFVLYANKYSRKDEQYRQNLIYADKQSDRELAKILALDESHLVVVSNAYFYDAVAMLKQVQEKYSPKAMLNIIEQAVQLITEAHKFAARENSLILAADSMMPLALFLVLRAGVPHLGAELALLDDLTGGSNFQSEMSGLAGYCYTTIKAAYEHITSNPFSRS